MYTTMLDLHRKHLAERHEQGELDYAFRELKAVRRSISFSNQVKALQLYHNERRARWRQYRTRR